MTRVDAARTNVELERGTGVDGARKSDEVWMELQRAPKVWMQLKRVKRVDVTRTRDKDE